ncbi:MAG: glycosyltransferase family 4 protein [Lachnospiraceae bacterium]
MTKMKVLMIGPARSVNGGISAVVNNYYRAGLNSRVELTYLATMEEGSKWYKLWVAIKALLGFTLSVGKYDLVHIHVASDISLYRKLPFIRIAARKKKKIIIHQHGGDIERFYVKQCGKRKQRLIKDTLEKAEKLLVITPSLQNFFSGLIKADKILLFPNAVFVPEKVKKDYDQSKVLFLGRLCREKGIQELLLACENLHREFPRLQLFLGGVWEEQKLKKMADNLGEWVHQLGWIGGEEKEKYLEECNLFVLPSYFEGHPVALLEGMAYQCACIGSDIEAISHMLIHEKNGLLTKVKDSHALEKELRKCLLDSRLQSRLGEAAGQTIREDYDMEKNLRQLIKLYDDLLK